MKNKISKITRQYEEEVKPDNRFNKRTQSLCHKLAKRYRYGGASLSLEKASFFG